MDSDTSEKPAIGESENAGELPTKEIQRSVIQVGEISCFVIKIPFSTCDLMS
jgi:hypothetical protein